MTNKRKIKVLCICQMGGSRSPSACHVLKEMGFNSKFCALSPTVLKEKQITKELLEWADKILVFHGDIEGEQIPLADSNKKDFTEKFPEYLNKTTFIFQLDPWGIPVRECQLNHFRSFFIKSDIIKGMMER